MRLGELKDSPSRGSRAIYRCLALGMPATFEALYPEVKAAYQIGKHRSASYIKKEVRGTIKWLTY